MSYYYSVRGWLDVSGNPEQSIKSVLHESDFFTPGDERWCWVKKDYPDVIFFASELTKHNLEIFEEELSIFLSLKEVFGFFFVSGEDGQNNYIIKVTEDSILRDSNASFLQD